MRRTRSQPAADAFFDALASLTPGQEVGAYVLDAYIGCGKIGHVYKAHRKDIPEIVQAVKIVHQLKEGWETEIKKVGGLRNVPNVVQFHDLGTAMVRPSGRSAITVQYTVWDYIEPGRSLKSILKEPSSVPASFLLATVETILRVLHACQSRGVPRHGDLHPGNILIGQEDGTVLDVNNRPAAPVFVSDFGYGATGGRPSPKDDFEGLASIVNAVIQKIDWAQANSGDRQLVMGMKEILRKTLSEPMQSERAKPKDILQALSHLKLRAGTPKDARAPQDVQANQAFTGFSVGAYQVSEMLGDNWLLWKSLFVPGLPARTQILEHDITSVITGPRGCGKTMLFRRLSERLIIECGPIVETDPKPSAFVGLYVNANDISDAFSRFPENPDQALVSRLYCFTHLCILSDLLAVESAHSRMRRSKTTSDLLDLLTRWFGRPHEALPIIGEENQLERFRAVLEQVKNSFLVGPELTSFPGRADFGHHAWLKRSIPELRRGCMWMGQRVVLLFVDDYTTPRLPENMQRVLNRMFFQRSAEFVFKIATEAATTFLPEDSTGKALQVGDDYRLVDLGEEALFMNDDERIVFLTDVFTRRLASDQRVHSDGRTLAGLLGSLGKSKTAFARLLRLKEPADIVKAGALRGATKRKALYFGHDVFCSLWSGDTRILIQLMQDLVEAAAANGKPIKRIGEEDQDRAFRNGGSHWLDMQTRNQPSDPKKVRRLLEEKPHSLAGGTYGTHLKAIVEAFKDAARFELLGPMYLMEENGRTREVPKMAFRIEITDEFRLDELATEIYRDLVRYGIFMRDARGKSVRGAMVPRLYLRRLLLPYCVLALSKRDSVSMSCEWFSRLLLQPDKFTESWRAHRQPGPVVDPKQRRLGFDQEFRDANLLRRDAAYDDTRGED